MLKPLLSKINFQGLGFKFSLEDLDTKTIIGLVIVLAAIIYLVKG